MKEEIKSKIFNVIILDKSGSMSSIRKQAVDSVNETLGAIRAALKTNPETEQFVTLVAFCGCELKTIIDTQNITTVENINEDQYVPCCMTPLYDAIGSTITKLHNLISGVSTNAASVTIITDGYENASSEFSFKAVKALIDSYKKEGWLFAYIGADHDVESVAYSLSIDNSMRFEKSEEGTREMSRKASASRTRWMAKMSLCMNECLSSMAPEEVAEKKRQINENFFDL